MTFLEPSIVQVLVIIGIAPVATALWRTGITGIRQKEWRAPWNAYYRVPSYNVAVAMGASVALIAVLPLMERGAFAQEHGSIFALIGLFALIAGAVAWTGKVSILPKALFSVSVMLLALGIATAQNTGAAMLAGIATAQPLSVSLALIAFISVLFALAAEKPTDDTHDVAMVLRTALGVFMVNGISVFVMGNGFTHEFWIFSLSMVIGKALIGVVVIDILLSVVKYRVNISPVRMIQFGTALSIASIVVTLWSYNM